jgi:hypothetical protein
MTKTLLTMALALGLSAGAAMAQSANTGNNVSGMDTNSDGKVSVGELRDHMKSNTQALQGLSPDQVRALQDECKNDNIADNKSTCDELSKIKQ